LKLLGECRLRPAAEADRDFLFALFLSERRCQFANVAWSEEQTRQLLRMQFEAQRRHYGSRFPDAVHSIVLLNGEAVGQLYLDRQIDQFIVVDFALAPEFRRLGIGSKIIASIQADAAAAGKQITGHVDRSNPATRFWQHLGFHLTGEDSLYLKMEWRSA
jgi:ribosomal protein S18 acetylase RimI-like enzyme